MKYALALLSFFFLISSAIAQPIGMDSVKNKRILIGKVTQANIADSIWYKENLNGAIASDSEIDQLNEYTSKVKVEVYFGTWCDDSQMWVPAFIGLMAKTNLKADVELIALDRSKKSTETQKLGEIIDKVPTFVVWRDDKECGRIVESPEESLVKDLTKILIMSSENE